MPGDWDVVSVKPVDPWSVVKHDEPKQDVPEKPGAFGTFVSAALSRVNPIEIAKGLGQTLTHLAEHPVDATLEGMPIVGSLKRAKAAYDKGDQREAAVHLLGAVIPFGGSLESTGTKLVHGEVAQAAGELTGDVAAALIGMKGPSAVRAIAGKVQDVAGPLWAATKAAVPELPIVPRNVRDLLVNPIKAGVEGFQAERAAMAAKETAALPTAEVPAGQTRAPLQPPLATEEPAPIAETPEPPAAPEEHWDPSKLPPDPVKQTEWFKKAEAEMRARRAAKTDSAKPADSISTESKPAEAPEVPAEALPEIQRTVVSDLAAGKSSNIESIGYHPESQRMHVEFKGGRVYEFVGVTPEEHQAFITAKSIGSHFARQIRPRFPTPGETPKAVARAADDAAQAPMFGTGTDVSSAPAGEPATLQANEAQAGRPAAGASQGVPDTKSIPSSNQSGQGAPTEILIPGEDRAFQGRYEIRELKDIQASHHGQTFQPNPKYTLRNDRDYSRSENQGKIVNGALPGKFKPQLLINDNPDASNGPPVLDEAGNAVGGNGRTMTLHRVYAGNQEGAQAYRDLLSSKASQFGLDPEHVKGFEQPVLVRTVGYDELGNAQNAVTDLNKTGTAELRPAERAIADSRRVSQATLDDLAARLDTLGPDANLSKALSGEHGPQILKRLIDDGVISPQERAAYADGSALTKEGQARISKLLLGRFFRDPAQLDNIAPVVRNKLERLAAPLAKLEGSGEWNLTPRVREAMDLIEEAQSHGTKNLAEFLKQQGLFGEQRYNPEAVTLAKAFQRMSGGKLTESVRQYTRAERFAEQHASAKEGLFGGEVIGEAPQAQQAFQESFSPSGKPAPSAIAKREAAQPKTTAQKLGDQLLETE